MSNLSLYKHLMLLQDLAEKIEADKASQSEKQAFDSIVQLIELIHELEKTTKI